MARREQRIARSIGRHHMYVGQYSGSQGSFELKFSDHLGVDQFGEYDETVISVDYVSVLRSQLPTHENGDTITDPETGAVYELGTQIDDDGYVRTIETHFAHV